MTGITGETTVVERGTAVMATGTETEVTAVERVRIIRTTVDRRPLLVRVQRRLGGRRRTCTRTAGKAEAVTDLVKDMGVEVEAVGLTLWRGEFSRISWHFY